jgi:hypothetical protein
VSGEPADHGTDLHKRKYACLDLYKEEYMNTRETLQMENFKNPKQQEEEKHRFE